MERHERSGPLIRPTDLVNRISATNAKTEAIPVQLISPIDRAAPGADLARDASEGA
jgi:hypothetical protein